MKIIRHENAKGEPGYAADTGDGVFRSIEGYLFNGMHVTDKKAEVTRLLAPIVPPTIWCIGLNYRQHADEAGMQIPERPVLFAKGVNSIQDPGSPIVIPTVARSSEVDYECELVVIIGRKCKNVSREQALDHVFGYTCGNDVSARDWQLKFGGSQWSRGKSFDTFAPLGPCIVTRESLPNPNALAISTLVNGETMQQSNTGDMIFDVAALVAFLSQSTTLLPGTLIFTGTPQGVGMARKPPRWLKAGDEVSVVIDGIGTLTNPVTNES